jgi:hypothetical protein
MVYGSQYLIMTMPYTKSGKCGNMVWQRARYGQICYPAFIPFNPRSPAQCVVRANLGAVSKRWRTLTQDQRHVWIAIARTKKSRRRLGQCGPLTGFNYFVKINVALANRGQPQVDLPPEYPRFPQLAVSGLFDTSTFDQPPVGPTLFLQANQLIDDWDDAPRKFAAPVPPPA